MSARIILRIMILVGISAADRSRTQWKTFFFTFLRIDIQRGVNKNNNDDDDDNNIILY